jgi:uncharacterized protein (TIGR03000 family)
MRYAPLLRGVHLVGLTVLLLTAGPAALARAQEGSGTRGGYLPPTPAQPPAAGASLEIRLPADAVLEIQGVRMRPTGEVRRFVSPPLEVGKRYTYTLKATWRVGLKEVARERTVPVVAGQEVVVDLRKEEPPQKNGQPPKRDEGSRKK